jgi:hypothetical protein
MLHSNSIQGKQNKACWAISTGERGGGQRNTRILQKIDSGQVNFLIKVKPSIIYLYQISA